MKTTTAEATGPVLRLFAGKGGVGKTTCAAAFAVTEARAGHRILVASTDPAHSLGDALAMELGAEARKVAGAPGLAAVEIDAESAWTRWLAPRRAVLAAIGERGTVFTQEDLAPLLELRIPGVDELLGLLECLRLAREDGAASLVVDAAPTGHTLRLLEMPDSLDALATVLDAMEGRHRALSAAFGSGGAGTANGAGDLISDLHAEAAGLRRLLRDPARTKISWVLLPEPLAISETDSALRRLADLGLGVAELVVNRISPHDDACAAALGRARWERHWLAEIRRRFPDLPIRGVAESAAEPVGPDALARLVAAEVRWASGDAMQQASPSGPDPARAKRPSSPPLGGTARLVLVGGKGGVGKSTCAAALALALAGDGTGVGVDLVSTDPAPSLARLFGLEASPSEPQRLDSAPGELRVQELDAESRFAGFRQRLVDRLDLVARRGDDRRGGELPVERSVFESLVAATPPGLDELHALGELAERLATGDESPRIVVDMAPTGHALRLLELPDLASAWTRSLMKLLLDYRQVFGLGTLAEELLALSKSIRHVRDLLRDPRRCAFVAVARPAALPVAETGRLGARLDALGIGVGGVVVNAVVPPDLEPCRVRRAQQDAWIARLAGHAGARAILLAPIRFPCPEGVQGLRDWYPHWAPLDP